MMHNVPKHYAAKGVANGKVLKFDIRRPTKNEQLWNKQKEKNQTKECIISHSEIRNSGQTRMNKKIDYQQENNQKKNQTKERRGKETEPTNDRGEETHNNREEKKNAQTNQQVSGNKRQKTRPRRDMGSSQEKRNRE